MRFIVRSGEEARDLDAGSGTGLLHEAPQAVERSLPARRRSAGLGLGIAQNPYTSSATTLGMRSTRRLVFPRIG